MKFKEFTDPNERSAKANYVSSRWRDHQGIVNSALATIVNYLFVLNSGALAAALAAALAYLATKTAPINLYAPVWCFSLGLVFITVRAALDYYISVAHFGGFRKDIDLFYKNELDWAVILDRDNRRGNWDWLLHLLGWSSGIVFFVGMWIGVRAL